VRYSTRTAIVGVLVSVVGLAACSSDAPVRRDMQSAYTTVVHYCRPPLHQPVVRASEVRRAAGHVARFAQQHPDEAFRISKEAEPTTAGELLDDMKDHAQAKGCPLPVRAIDAAR
jgi:hypothetical protein